MLGTELVLTKGYYYYVLLSLFCSHLVSTLDLRESWNSFSHLKNVELEARQAELHTLSVHEPRGSKNAFRNLFLLPLLLLVASCPLQFQAHKAPLSNSCGQEGMDFLFVLEKVPELRLSGPNGQPRANPVAWVVK